MVCKYRLNIMFSIQKIPSPLNINDGHGEEEDYSEDYRSDSDDEYDDDCPLHGMMCPEHWALAHVYAISSHVK